MNYIDIKNKYKNQHVRLEEVEIQNNIEIKVNIANESIKKVTILYKENNVKHRYVVSSPSTQKLAYQQGYFSVRCYKKNSKCKGNIQFIIKEIETVNGVETEAYVSNPKNYGVVYPDDIVHNCSENSRCLNDDFISSLSEDRKKEFFDYMECNFNQATVTIIKNLNNGKDKELITSKMVQNYRNNNTNTKLKFASVVQNKRFTQIWEPPTSKNPKKNLFFQEVTYYPEEKEKIILSSTFQLKALVEFFGSVKFLNGLSPQDYNKLPVDVKKNLNNLTLHIDGSFDVPEEFKQEYSIGFTHKGKLVVGNFFF